MSLHESGGSHSSNGRSNEKIEDDPEHHNSQNYVFLSESANPVIHLNKRRVKYIFEQPDNSEVNNDAQNENEKGKNRAKMGEPDQIENRKAE